MKQGDIARALNLSRTTVSRAISGKGRVSEETRQKILELLGSQAGSGEPGHVPAGAASAGLIPVGSGESEAAPAGTAGAPGADRRTRNICVAIPEDIFVSGNNYFTEVLYGVCEFAALSHYNVIAAKLSETDISVVEGVVEEKKADGIILTRSLEHDRNLRYLSSTGFPVAVAGHTGYPDVISVDVDNEKAAEDLTSILIAKGYRNFTCIVGDLNYIVNRSRRGGFLRAIEKNGIPAEQQCIYAGTFNPDLLREISENVLSRKTECIVCGDDELAVKVISWLSNEGYRIPVDVGVASFYNSPVLGVITPTVTAVDVSARRVGSTLAAQLISRIEGKPYQSMVEVDYNILVRKSTNRVR